VNALEHPISIHTAFAAFDLPFWHRKSDVTSTHISNPRRNLQINWVTLFIDYLTFTTAATFPYRLGLQAYRWYIYFSFPIYLFLSQTQHFRNSHCFCHQVKHKNYDCL